MKPIASAALILLATAPLAAAADPDWQKVADALGKSGSVQQGGIYKVSLPRSDLQVRLDGVAIKPALALGGWLAFAPMGSASMAMGDLVLTQDEVAPVMTKALADGLEVTAVHNHLLRAEPLPFYMHVMGRGDPVKLAAALHDALAASRTPLGPPASGSSAPPSVDLDTAMLDKTLGAKGQTNGGVVQYNLPRAESVTEAKTPVPPAMGTATAINFQPTGGGKAAITGDFVLTADEVNPVLRVLRDNRIEVTAVHNHMLRDEPRLFFVHFWANDDAATLARGLRAALDKVDVRRG